MYKGSMLPTNAPAKSSRKPAELAKAGASSRHSQIKVSKPRAEAGSLHVELFLGLYARILAFCLEQREDGSENRDTD